MTKNLLLALILVYLPKFGPPRFFVKNLAPSVTGYHGQLPSCTITEKTNDPILRKLEKTDGRKDRQESDFIGRCRTSVERPINGQTIKYEIKVQALKDISRLKLRYLVTFFCAKSIKQPQLWFTKRRLLFCLIARIEELHFVQLGE